MLMDLPDIVPLEVSPSSVMEKVISPLIVSCSPVLLSMLVKLLNVRVKEAVIGLAVVAAPDVGSPPEKFPMENVMLPLLVPDASTQFVKVIVKLSPALIPAGAAST